MPVYDVQGASLCMMSRVPACVSCPGCQPVYHVQGASLCIMSRVPACVSCPGCQPVYHVQGASRSAAGGSTQGSGAPACPWASSSARVHVMHETVFDLATIPPQAISVKYIPTVDAQG
jgi:hypothetical protein